MRLIIKQITLKGTFHYVLCLERAKGMDIIMNKKYFVFISIFVICFIVLIGIIWPSIGCKKQAIQRFKANTETYIKIKDYMVQKAVEKHSHHLSIGHLGAIVDYSKDTSPVNKNDIQYAPQSVKEAINKLITISENDFDFGRIEDYEAQYIVTLEFDWEEVRNKTHKIIYCEDKKILNKYLKSISKDIYIKSIMNQWYYVELDSDIFHK